MIELDLPFPPFVHTDTSVEAAEAMDEHNSRLAAQVLGYVRRRGGATCDEAEQELLLRHQTASARLRELVLAGRIVDSGHRRLTRSRRRAIVWIVQESNHTKEAP